MAAWLCERRDNLIPLLKFSSINADNESVQELLSEAVSLVLIASKDGGYVVPFKTVPSNLKKNETCMCF